MYVKYLPKCLFFYKTLKPVAFSMLMILTILYFNKVLLETLTYYQKLKICTRKYFYSYSYKIYFVFDI